MNACSLLISDFTAFPKDWKEMELKKSGREGSNSFTEWEYSKENNTFSVHNNVSGSGGDSEVTFNFNTIKDKDYLDLLFQASKFNGTQSGLIALMAPDSLTITRINDHLVEIERK